MVTTQTNTTQSNKLLPDPTSRHTFTVDGQQYRMLIYRSGRFCPDFWQSIGITNLEIGFRMLKREEAEKIIGDIESRTAFINKLEPGDWGFVNDPVSQKQGGATIFSLNVGGGLEVSEGRRFRGAPIAFLKAEVGLPRTDPMERMQSFPVTKTDPERWRALKRDLGIGDQTKKPEIQKLDWDPVGFEDAQKILKHRGEGGRLPALDEFLRALENPEDRTRFASREYTWWLEDKGFGIFAGKGLRNTIRNDVFAECRIDFKTGRLYEVSNEDFNALPMKERLRFYHGGSPFRISVPKEGMGEQVLTVYGTRPGKVFSAKLAIVIE